MRFSLPPVAPLHPDDPGTAPGEGLALPASVWRMVDEIDLLVPDGGPTGLGYVRGQKRVNPKEWFFAAHFFQDPVWPGSLGLESFQQLCRVLARERWPELRDSHRFQAVPLQHPHTWIYRGQILPTAGLVTVDAVVTGIREEPVPTLVADGFLAVDGKIIYEMQGFGVSLVPRSC